MEKKIVKAEILFSRQCPLSCSYCGMKSDKENNRTVEEWNTGMLELHKLGCEFIAFYGAEPLMEYDKLPSVINYCENKLGIDTTIITSGAVPNLDERLIELHMYGARSLSMSFDPAPLGIGEKIKSDKAVETLMNFRKLYDVRDVAAIATLTPHNFREFPKMVEEMTNRNIWSFFDFIHTDRGQPGSKCAKIPDSLLFGHKHYLDLKEMLYEVLELKKNGCLCHTSKHFIDIVLRNMYYHTMYSWTCSKQNASWLTIDCDGSVIPCDDFCGNNMDYDMTNIYSRFGEFVNETKTQVKAHDCHCCWNTHIDAHGIMSGQVKIEDYVHGRE